MSRNRSRRGSSKGPAKSTGKGKSTQANQGKAGKKSRKRSNKGKRPAIDPNRPFWGDDESEARVHDLIGAVRPVPDPTVLVRSLGPPPLGRFADNAPHFFAAVYDKAQHFATTMATANGVLRAEEDGEETSDSS